MSFIRTLGTGFAWTTAGMAVGKAVALFNIFLILSQLTVYEYGVTELVMSVVSTVGLFLLPGLAATVTTDLGVERTGREYGRMNALFSEFLTLNIALGVCAWAVLFFGSTIVAELTGNILVDHFFKIVSFSFLISPFRMITTMLATAAVRFADQSLFGPLEEIAKGLLLLFFFFVRDLGAAGLLWATVLAPLFTAIVFAPRTLSAYREFAHAAPVDRQPLWRALREHRKWSVASTYANTIGKNIRIWIIKVMLGTEAVGLYAFASGVYAHASGFSSLQAALTPIVPRYADRPGLLARILTASMKYQLTLSVAAALATCAAAAVLVHVAFPQYAPSLILTIIMLAALIPNGVTANLTPVFATFKEQRTLFLSIIVRTASMIVFLPAGIAVWGLAGVGVEMVITMTIVSIERFHRIRQLLPGVALTPATLGIADPEEARILKEVLTRIRSWPLATMFGRR